MSVYLGQPARNVLEAPFLAEGAVERLGRAIWLYVRLLTLTNHQGLIIRKRDQLATDLHVAQEVIDQWVSRLAEAKLIEVRSPAPYLVIKLGMWPDETSEERNAGAPAYSHAEQLLHKQQLKDSYRHGERPQSAADADLLNEILETLGESDAASFEKVIALYSPNVIRTALERVRRAKDIRKSRTALFRHLLPRLAQQSLGNH
jgi:hypothetical protein